MAWGGFSYFGSFRIFQIKSFGRSIIRFSWMVHCGDIMYIPKGITPLRFLTIRSVVFLLALVLVGCNKKANLDFDDSTPHTGLGGDTTEVIDDFILEEHTHKPTIFKTKRRFWRVERFEDRSGHDFEVRCSDNRLIFSDMDTGEELTSFYYYKCDEMFK